MKEDFHIELRQPFYGAGTTYGWKKDIPDLCGFGVNVNALQGEGDVYIKVKDITYKIEKIVARNLCREYSSFFSAKGCVMIGVIPRAKCLIVN